MARKITIPATNATLKEKNKRAIAQKFVDDAKQLYDEAKTPQEKKAWAKTTLSKMDRAINHDSENADAWNSRGLAKIELGDQRSAVEDCTKAIEIDPKNAHAWNNRGAARNALYDVQNAIDDLTKAIELEPNLATAWLNRGFSKHTMIDNQGAIADCNESIKLDSKNAYAWSIRGHAKFSLKNYEDALGDFDKALSLDPQNEIIQSGRQAVIVAWDEEKTRLKEKEYHDLLEKKSIEFSNNYKWNIRLRWGFFSIVVVIIAGYTFYLWKMDVFSNITSTKNQFGLLPYLALLFAILSPFIWLIRINIKEAERNLTLREDYDGRLTVELYLKRFFNNTERREFAQRHMTYWMYNNPSETLIRLANKSKETPELPQVEQIRNFTKNTPTDPQP